MKNLIMLLFLVFSISLNVHSQRTTGMPAQRFEQILNDIDHRQNYRDKYSYAHDILLRYHLSTDQLIEICRRFPKQIAKYNLALAAYPNIIDKNNFFDTYDLFTNYSFAIKLYHNTQANSVYEPDMPNTRSQNSHRYEQRSYGDKMNCTVPPSQFNYILQTIKEQTFDDKMEAMAKRHIEKECFSKEQFRQILSLFSRDDNILSLIRFSYNIVPFKKDMYEFRDLLDFSSSKKELDEFLIQNR